MIKPAHVMPVTVNIAAYLPAMARSAPQQQAVIVSSRHGGKLHYRSLCFAELESLSNRHAHGLAEAGIRRGMRTLLMVRQGIDFISLVFALFKMGAVPVLIDPGMGVSRLLDCIRTVNLDAFVGIPLAQFVRVVRPGPFSSIPEGRFVTVGHKWFWSGPTLAHLTRHVSDRFELVPVEPTETAAILFTSGSTGPAKGVVYEHGMFDAQVRIIQSTYGIEPGEIDLPTFPLFALFSVAMGMTIVLPDMDPSHPARINPANVVDAVRERNVTNTFGSPALWARVAAYCVDRGITLPTLRRILIAGAPVPPNVVAQLHRVLRSSADIHTPYGATESLPVSTISGREIIGSGVGGSGNSRGNALVAHESGGTVKQTLLGAGTCVGRVVREVDVRIIQIDDAPILRWSEEILAPNGEVGEICVRSPSATHAYFNLPAATLGSKIKDGDTIWHRIGDVGYFDEQGRLWFCGRKAHRVQTESGTLFTECIEPVLNQHPAVARCALVGVGETGRQRPVIVLEVRPGRRPPRRNREKFAAEIIDAAFGGHPSDRAAPRQVPNMIGGQQWSLFEAELVRYRAGGLRPPNPVLFLNSLPVDVRHNAKINRELLAAWAAKKLAII